jgi:hypothetical protein
MRAHLIVKNANKMKIHNLKLRKEIFSILDLPIIKFALKYKKFILIKPIKF